MNRQLVLLAVFASLTVLLAGGCGGSSSSGGVGTLGVTVLFPPQAAAVPTALPQVTASVRLTLTPAEGDWVRESLLVSPPGGGPVSTTIPDVPVGWVTLLAQAFATPDGAGDVIARASLTFLVVNAQTTNVRLVTEALCTSVSVKPSTITLAPGRSAFLQATAYDADGNVLLGAAFDWVSSAPGVANVNPATGAVEAVTEGTATITAREQVTGKSGTCEVTVAEWSDVVTLQVPVTNTDGVLTPILQKGAQYRFVASGLWYPWGGNAIPADASWWAPNDIGQVGNPLAWTERNSLRLDDVTPLWSGTADGISWAPHTLSFATHTYRYEWPGNGTQVRIWLYDSISWDNTGGLSVTVQRRNW